MLGRWREGFGKRGVQVSGMTQGGWPPSFYNIPYCPNGIYVVSNYYKILLLNVTLRNIYPSGEQVGGATGCAVP